MLRLHLPARYRTEFRLLPPTLFVDLVGKLPGHLPADEEAAGARILVRGGGTGNGRFHRRKPAPGVARSVTFFGHFFFLSCSFAYDGWLSCGRVGSQPPTVTGKVLRACKDTAAARDRNRAADLVLVLGKGGLPVEPLPSAWCCQACSILLPKAAAARASNFVPTLGSVMLGFFFCAKLD